MSLLPDIHRPRLTQPAAKALASIARFAKSAAWRTLHPGTRGRYLQAERPVPLTRIYYTAPDGWQAPVFFMPPAPGGAGEPVLLAHALGVGCDAFRYGRGQTLASALSKRGFAVYLLGHRGDSCALPPSRRALADATFDEILGRDLPAAVACVCEHSGFPRLHFVGHGLGGLLGMAWAAQTPDALASVVAIGSPLRFERVATELRRTARALSLLPPHWEIPPSALARLAAPLLDDHAAGGARTRGILEFASEDLPIALLRQLMDWQDRGLPTTREGHFDYSESVVTADVPLLAIAGTDDAIAGPEAVRPGPESWGHADVTMWLVDGAGHLDLLLSAAAADSVFGPVSDWLQDRRRLAWERDGELRAS